MYGFTDAYVLEATDVNRNDPADLAFIEKAAFVASGRWSVPRSSDGSSYDESDLIADKSKVVNNAWWVIESPSGQSWCIQVINLAASVSTATFRVKHSRGAGFTGGTPSATQVPSAADEAVIRGGGTDAIPTGEEVFADSSSSGSSQARVLFGAVDRESDAFFFTYLNLASGGSHSYHQFFCDPFKHPHDDDDYPYWFGCSGSSTLVGYSDSGFSNTEANMQCWAYYGDGMGTWTARKTTAMDPGGGLPPTTSSDPITGAIELHAIVVGRPSGYTGSTAEYTRGLSSLFLWAGLQAATPFIKTYADSTYIHLGEDVVAGWDGTLPDPATYVGTWTDLGDVRVYVTVPIENVTTTVLPAAPAAAGLVPAGGIGLG